MNATFVSNGILLTIIVPSITKIIVYYSQIDIDKLLWSLWETVQSSWTTICTYRIAMIFELAAARLVIWRSDISVAAATEFHALLLCGLNETQVKESERKMKDKGNEQMIEWVALCGLCSRFVCVQTGDHVFELSNGLIPGWNVVKSHYAS